MNSVPVDMIIENGSIALAAACVSIVYAGTLAGEDTPLNAWFGLLRRWHEAGGWRAWISSPLGGCERCCAGQIALWYSILTRGGYDLQSIGGHVTAASGAVLFALIIGHCYRWIRRKI